MTEEKIKKLQDLVYRRERLQNEIEKFNEIFSYDKGTLDFEILDTRRECGYKSIHFIKDHYGYMYEALQKIYARLQKELENVQKKIDEF